MSDLDFLKKAVVKVQQRSPFDKSFRNLLTTKCGTLTPLLCDEVIPNTTVNLKLALNCTLPPLASETFMNVNLKVEAFFCPSRLVFQGFTEWIQGNDDSKYGNTTGKLRCPLVALENGNSTTTTPYIVAGSLMDYLGFRADLGTATETQYVNAMPLLCYHLIADEWYRNPLVQRSAFTPKTDILGTLSWSPRYTLVNKPADINAIGYITKLNAEFLDGVKLGELRQRNFGTDYFTVATPNPQNGPAQKVSMILPSTLKYISIDPNTEYLVNESGVEWSLVPSNNDDEDFSPGGSIGVNSSTTGALSFTIASLRACNALQVWEERNLLSNDRYVDFLKVQYNASLKDSIAQRPQYLGSASFPVYSKGVYQTSADSNTGNNPFDTVGSRYGHAYAEGTDFIIDHFTAEEHGYIFVLVSLVPEVTYSSGVNKYLTRYLGASSYGECPNHILQNVGLQPVYASELIDSYDETNNAWVFGYVDRFADIMTRVNELHGLLRDGKSLESFALQRNMYGVNTTISDQFLRIPTSFMNQVTAVDDYISDYGCWIDSYLDYKVVMPLAKYCVPSLQDPAYEHGDTVVVNRRGRMVD